MCTVLLPPGVNPTAVNKYIKRLKVYNGLMTFKTFLNCTIVS